MIFFAIVIIGGGLVFIIERMQNTGVYNTPVDGFWWGIVTLTTVGYGDYAPRSLPARILSVLIMMSGVVITSIFSGTIASIYVDRKIREGKGLQNITLKNHVMICGWNRYGQNLIESLRDQHIQDGLQLAIISEMAPEDFDDIRAAFPDIEMRFIRGDIASETVLQRGNVGSAQSCIIIPDESGGKPFLVADDKTILSAWAIKSLNEHVHLTAQIIHSQNASHLTRAHVDEIVHGEEITRHILSSSTIIHGAATILGELIDPTSPNRIIIQNIPTSFVGKTFSKYVKHLLDENKGLCIGILSEERTTSLMDILDKDSSGIDEFIKRKFAEAEINLEKEQDTALQVNLCPGTEYIIKGSDSAFLIGVQGG